LGLQAACLHANSSLVRAGVGDGSARGAAGPIIETGVPAPLPHPLPAPETRSVFSISAGFHPYQTISYQTTLFSKG
ncbi:MAG: hypothetical protein PHF72_11190, partial [Gammaproteobacteria bacterium]|nr:hypothetical protein [Gammaproteobacteria bacterium]